LIGATGEQSRHDDHVAAIFVTIDMAMCVAVVSLGVDIHVRQLSLVQKATLVLLVQRVG
jgi:hypothetical protein